VFTLNSRIAAGGVEYASRVRPASSNTSPGCRPRVDQHVFRIGLMRERSPVQAFESETTQELSARLDQRRLFTVCSPAPAYQFAEKSGESKYTGACV